MGESLNDLVVKCSAASRAGADFPTVWETVLRCHALVVGPPIQTIDGERLQLEIQLIDGHRLTYNSTSNEYFILRAYRRRPF